MSGPGGTYIGLADNPPGSALSILVGCKGVVASLLSKRSAVCMGMSVGGGCMPVAR